MNNLKTTIKINLIVSAVFTLMCISFRADISLLAFPVALVFLLVLYFSSHDQLVKKASIVHLGAIRRVFQYEPFVFITAFVIQRSGKEGFHIAFDAVCSIVWIVVTVISFRLQCLKKGFIPTVMNGSHTTRIIRLSSQKDLKELL